MARRVVDVLVPVALDQAYSYRVPEEIDVGARRHRRACRSARARRPAWSGRRTQIPIPRLDNRLKDVEHKLDLPPLKPELRKFVDWVADYTLGSRGMVLRMCLRLGEHLGTARERVGVRLAGQRRKRMTPARGASGAARGRTARGKSEPPKKPAFTWRHRQPGR